MFNLLSFYAVTQHLKKISPNMYRQIGNEVMLHCPFCDDAKRENASSHGHMYLSIDTPVFHCFRCNTSGFLISLLLETDFDDNEALNELKKYVKYKFSKNYFKRSREKPNVKLIHENIHNLTNQFKANYPNHYEYFIYYIKNRIGDIIDVADFLIYPTYIYKQYLAIAFINADKTYSCWRNIDKNYSNRYILNASEYFFQSKDFDKFSQIVISEGPFDNISNYLYLREFKDAFFISLNSSNYIKFAESLIIKHLFVGNYEINFVLDKNINDIKLKYKSKYLKQLNNQLSFKFWKPSITKDTNEYPKITEL